MIVFAAARAAATKGLRAVRGSHVIEGNESEVRTSPQGIWVGEERPEERIAGNVGATGAIFLCDQKEGQRRLPR